MLKAIGKFIDTLPISGLFTQGEHNADTILFEVDRYYNGEDLLEYAFELRGIDAEGNTAVAYLTNRPAGDALLHLTWKVERAFTAAAGWLRLDLCAVTYEADQTEPEVKLRYQLPPIYVREAGGTVE